MFKGNIGIIAEGKGDQVVIRNILKSWKVDNSQVRNLLPSNNTDETSKTNAIGTLQGVRNKCLAICKDFFAIEDNNLIIIHLDTAELGRPDNRNFNISKPNKAIEPNYSERLRADIIKQINEVWLSGLQNLDRVIHAIAIEEIESWLLADFVADTLTPADAKAVFLKKAYAKMNDKEKNKAKNDPNFIFELFSSVFKKRKDLDRLAPNNFSLLLFVCQMDTYAHHHNLII